MPRLQPQDDPQFGPFLFERKSPTPPALMVGIGLLFTAFVVGLLKLLYASLNLSFLGTGGHIAVVIGVVLGSLLTWKGWGQRKTLFFHQRGVVRHSRKQSEPLAYESVESIRYVAKAMHYKGAYTGTMLKMDLHGPAELGYRPLRFSGKLKERRNGFFRPTYQREEELDAIHSALSEQIAGRMMSRVVRGEPVQWTQRDVISLRGLESDGVMIPLEQFGDLNMRDGKLVHKGKGKWFGRTLASQEDTNFYAGWLVLKQLAARYGEEGPASRDR